MDRAEAVRAGVAAADDHHALTMGRDEVLVGSDVTLATLVLQGEVVHREVNAGQLAARYRQVAWITGAAREHDGVELTLQIPSGQDAADVRAGLEHDTLL